MTRLNIICIVVLLTVVVFGSVFTQEFKPSDGAPEEKSVEKSVPKNDDVKDTAPVQAEGKSLKPQGKTIMAGSGYIPPPFYHSPISAMPPVPPQYPYPYPYGGYYQPPPTIRQRPFYQSNYLENYDVYYSRNNQ